MSSISSRGHHSNLIPTMYRPYYKSYLFLYPYSLTLSIPPAPCHCPRVAAYRPQVCLYTLVVDQPPPTATLPPLIVRALVRAPLREMYLFQPAKRKRRRKALYLSSLGEERVPRFSYSFTKYLFLLRKLLNS